MTFRSEFIKNILKSEHQNPQKWFLSFESPHSVKMIKIIQRITNI